MKNNAIPAHDFCYTALKNVSRSFYLNTVALRSPLRDYVCVAYLLCRIADTVEDDPQLPVADKHDGFSLFDSALTNAEVPDQWPRFVASLQASHHELALMEHYQQVLNRLTAFPDDIQTILIKHIRIMTGGMAEYCQKLEQRQESFQDLDQLDEYCYYVAGVVGELLTELFAAEMQISGPALLKLRQNAIAFGLALQYTNIIKDYAVDDERGITFWPLSVRPKHGAGKPAVRQMTRHCLAHMRNAFTYIEHLPKEEKTIRLFCLWPLFFAVATLREVNRDYARFERGEPVKISRKRMRFIMVLTTIFSRCNRVLDYYFKRYLAAVKKSLSD